MRRLLLALLLAHAVLAVARVPTAVLAKRAQEIAEFQRQGDVEYLLARNGLRGAEVVRWLQQHTPERCAVLFTGTPQGALEFAAAFLWPRLLVHEPSVAGAHATAGVPFARGTLAGLGEGELVLRATREDLALELRR